MKAQMLKMAGVKTEAAFYKKYPTQEAFMKAHGKAFKKAQIGTYIGGDKVAPIKPINYSDLYDQADMTVTGKTNKIRQEESAKQAALPANQQAKPDRSPLGITGGIINGLSGIVGDLAKSEGAEGMFDSLDNARYGKRIPKAQYGNIFSGGFNPGNTNVPSNIGFSPSSTALTSSGFQMPNAAQSFASNNPLPAGVPNIGSPQSSTMDKIGGIVGKYAGPAGELIGGLQALKAEEEAVQGAKQTRQLSDLALQASNTRPEQTQRKYVRPEDMITSGNQLSPTYGTGTNILAQEGVTVSGKPVSKKDVRKEKDVIKVLPSSSLYPEEEANYIRTTKSLKGLGKRDNKLEQQASDDFVDWYQHPETLKRFGENTGMDPARLQDFVGKALRTPVRPAKEDDYLRSEDNAQWRSPFWQDQNYRTLNKNTGEILYDADATPNIIQHELTHASNLDEVLGPKLMSILGKPTNVFRNEKAYIGRPTEAYGNFHEFRTNLGLKPGQKIDEATLKKLTKKKGLDQERFYRAYSPDKIAKAINTIAYNDEDGDVTYAQDGAEIQNTYAPDTLYDDLGYEPLEDSTQVKQYQDGGTPWGMISDKVTGLGQDLMGGQNAGGQIGKTAGKTIGNMIVPGLGGAIGGFVGGIAGQALDPNAKRLKREQEATSRNMQSMAFGQGARSIQAQNASYMEDGGYVSNDWNPQVIAKFGDHSPEDVYDFAHEGMESFRAGGHLKAYTPPSERAMETYAMGGELKTHWGGHMEEMSENPYLPDGGVTYMPHGQSHDEADGNGRTGIGITYGDNPVEVERREPIMKLKDGSTGEDNLVVFGNLEIPKYGVELLGDKKAKGMKFKNYVSDLSKSETKQNKTIQKSTEELADFTPRTSFDKLKFAGLQANVLGGNMKLKEIADVKHKAAALQNSINDTAEEFGLDADSLAKGKVKTAKTGGHFSKAQYGTGLDKYRVDFTKNSNNTKVDMNAGELANVNIPAIDYMRRDIRPLSPKGIVEPDMTPRGSVVPDSAGMLANEYEASNKPAGSKIHNYSWIEALNSVIPNLRPSDAEELNANQLLGEMYALSSNQEEPVQAQQYSPELTSPYSVSLQDQMNEITAQTRAAQRMAQGNPAAQAAIAAQAYEAINKVKGEEFRMNQGIADKVYTGNIAAMNDAKLKNLGILDQQYARQAQAKSNTKAVTQAALNSISDKYAKNSLENRTLKTYENMYNYRYDANGRLINMNQMPEFNIPTVGATSKPKDASGDDLLPIYNSKGETTGYKVKQDAKPKTKSKNGSIVKAMRNL